jgi:N-acetylmuramoyl-L-alanine amidase
LDEVFLSSILGRDPSRKNAHLVTGERSNRRRSRLGRAIVLVAVLLVVVVGLVAVSYKGPLKNLADDVIHLGSSSSPTQLDPSEFSSGACMAFPPTGGDNGKTVFLDAGHGGIDPGGVGTTESGQTVYESNVNLAIELDAMALLRARGYRVVVSRTKNTSVVHLSPEDVDGQLLSIQGAHDDVAARDICANLAHADALIGIYMDATSTSQTAGSVTLYDADRPFSQENLQLAELVQTTVLDAMNAQGWQIPNDGTLPDSGFGSSVGNPADGGLASEAAAYDHLLLIGPAAPGYFTTPSTMPGAVIEPLYLTDPFEGSIAVNTTDQQVIAQGIADAVEKYFAPAKPAQEASS